MKKLAIGCGVIAVIAIVAIIAICVSAGNELSKTYGVKYEVTGSAQSVDLTYQNEDGGTSQLSDVSLPWSLSFKGDALDFVYISAQNQGETGTVTATIYRDGEQFKSSTSSGAYVIASADGSL
jgi:hypothetical protein